MADAVITKFSNIRQLTVRSTSAVIKYDGSGKDPRAAGRELGADSLVTGAIQRSGDRIRVTVQLLRVQDGKSLWAEKFDEKFSDVFTVQDSIAERVAKAFPIELNDAEKQQLGRHYTDNPQAYLDYVKGRYYWERRTPDGLKKGLAYFQEAIGKDAKYTLAYAGLADSYNMMGNWSVLPAREAFPRSKEAAAKALAIDGTLGEARVALGFAKYLFDRDSRGAEIELREGIRLDPNYGEGHQWYGVYLASRGRFEEAVAEGKRAQEVEPLSLIVAAVRGWISFLARNYDDAIVLERNLVEIDPNFFPARYYLGQAYAQKAMFDEAIRELRKAVDLSAGDTRSLTALAHAYAMSGQRAKAYNGLARLKDLSWHEYAQPYDIGLIYAGVNDKDLAFEWLEKAREERAP
jgi:tetratricopeptide (TPR) repeat protein